MRVNLIAQACGPLSSFAEAGSISVTVRTAHGTHGDYFYSTDLDTLLGLLRSQKNAHSATIERFEEELVTTKCALLLDIEMHDKTLEEIGYFVD